MVRTFLRRKPRTRKDRVIEKLTAVRQRGTRAWSRVRHPRRQHAAARQSRLARLHLPHRAG